ncbi:ABC transporter permease [Pacificibacter marinus]|uniref:ABC transporter permease n=1 Tax=Pacificibacter marinus TaxID=658057 RepID=UPI001C0655B4|nr:ABC transporter permease [Pacificibacter marinus]MBU2867609.1 ABC transporter permease [Pacificibacter marinus]
MKSPLSLSSVMSFIYLACLALFIAAPMLVIVVFSFDANRFPTLPWGGFSIEWHKAALNDPMIIAALRNSAIVGFGTATLATILGFCAAYLDYRYHFFGKRAMMIAVAIPPAVPVAILGMAMLAFLSRTPIFGSPTAIIVSHTVIASSFAMALIRLRLTELGPDLEQAAWNLGASRAQAIRLIVLPFCRPSIMAAFFLSAAVSFDEFMVAWFVGGVHETLPVRILNMLQGQVNPKINAIGTVVLAISLTLVLIAQRLARTGKETR